ncbi:SH3 domain-containing protein [Amycolatopsis anabasis]|uniref:SH3 domain-containing protein n=1 Tax=Amycolatopsis anabasis TaxID=1840409 RepID=UPI00131B0156|nr:SH3 domain-containing protein [Amycolatopsis anabasis]
MILGIPKRVVIVLAVLIGVLVVYLMGSAKRPSEGAPGGGAAPGGCRVTVTADVLNVREAPAATAKLAGKYQQNAQVDAQPVVENGFRKLAENKWAASEFLKPVDGAPCG